MGFFELAVDWAPKLAKWAGKINDRKHAKDKAVVDELNRINRLFTDPVALASHYIEPDFQQFNPANHLEDQGPPETKTPVFRSLEAWILGYRELNKQLRAYFSDGLPKKVDHLRRRLAPSQHDQ